MSALKIWVQPPDIGPEVPPPDDWSNPTVAHILDWHQDNPSRKSHSPKAEKERRRIWGLMRAWFVGRFVADCKPWELQAFINAQPDCKSDWTRKRWNGTCQRPFNAAEKLGRILKNTFRGLTFCDGQNGRDWTDAEYRGLMRAAPPLFRRVLVWVRFSGMRPGESRELEFSNVRVDEGKILIEKHKMRYRTKKPRPIPLNRVLGKLLGWLKRNNPAGSKCILLNSHGRPWSCKALTRRLARLCVKIGLPADVKLHGGRHTFATHALMNGVELVELMELLGHKQFATTQKYVHVANKVEHLAGAMQKAVTPKPAPPKPRAKPAAPFGPSPLFDGLA
jgi:integrase